MASSREKPKEIKHRGSLPAVEEDNDDTNAISQMSYLTLLQSFLHLQEDHLNLQKNYAEQQKGYATLEQENTSLEKRCAKLSELNLAFTNANRRFSSHNMILKQKLEENEIILKELTKKHAEIKKLNEKEQIIKQQSNKLAVMKSKINYYIRRYDESKRKSQQLEEGVANIFLQVASNSLSQKRSIFQAAPPPSMPHQVRNAFGLTTAQPEINSHPNQTRTSYSQILPLYPAQAPGPALK